MDCILFPCITIKCITYFSKVIKESSDFFEEDRVVLHDKDLVFPENNSKGVIDIDDS